MEIKVNSFGITLIDEGKQKTATFDLILMSRQEYYKILKIIYDL